MIYSFRKWKSLINFIHLCIPLIYNEVILRKKLNWFKQALKTKEIQWKLLQFKTDFNIKTVSTLKFQSQPFDYIYFWVRIYWKERESIMCVYKSKYIYTYVCVCLERDCLLCPSVQCSFTQTSLYPNIEQNIENSNEFKIKRPQISSW